jgi:arylsulfatase A-like enzyme
MAQQLIKLSLLILSIFAHFSFIQIVKAEESPRKIILLITVDSLRQDSFGLNNSKKNLTPNLDRLVENSFEFSHAYSTSSWTKPAMVSMLSSRRVSQHLVVLSNYFKFSQETTSKENKYFETLQKSGGIEFKEKMLELTKLRGENIPPTTILFPELLKDFKRLAVVGNTNLLTVNGFDRGWDEFHYLPEAENPITFFKSVTPQINKQILEFIDNHKSENVIIWAHYNDVHYPYGRKGRFLNEARKKHKGVISNAPLLDIYAQLFSRAPSETGAHEALVDLYESGIKQFDHDLEKLFAGLRKRNLFDQSLIVLTSDHGEEFYEHGEWMHGNNLYNETLAIPLLVKLPGQTSHVVVEEPVSLVDIAPTILDFCETKTPKEYVGRSLMPIFKGREIESAPMISGHAFMNLKDFISVISKNKKLLLNLNTGGGEIYDLNSDPHEQHPIKGDFANIYSKRLRKLFVGNVPALKPVGVLLYEQATKEMEQIKSIPEDPEEREKIIKRLKTLGYL